MGTNLDGEAKINDFSHRIQRSEVTADEASFMARAVTHSDGSGPAKLLLKYDEGLEHKPDFLATLDGQRSKLGRSLLPFIATPGDEHTPFRDCKGLSRSAIAAVTPDGGSNWMAAEELEPLTQTFCDPNSTPEGVAGGRGRRAWYEGVLGISGGQGRVSWPTLTEISNRSEERRASWPGRRVRSSRSLEGRVLGPRIG